MRKTNVTLVAVLALFLAGCTKVTSTSASANSASTAASASVASSGTSTSADSTSVVTTYAVTKAAGMVGGDVSIDKAQAAEGEIVTLTVSVNAGYRFNQISLSDDITLTTVTAGVTYTFVMPAKAVVVSASFVVTHKIALLKNVNLQDTEFDWSSLTLKEADVYAEGETVTATMAAVDQTYGIYYTRVDNVYINVNDSVIHPTYDATKKTSSGGVLSLSFTFTMPAQDVSLYFYLNTNNYFDVSKGHKVTIQADSGLIVLGYDPAFTDYTTIAIGVVRQPSHLVTASWKLDSGDTWTDLGFQTDYTTHNTFNDDIGYTNWLSSDKLTGDVTIKLTSTAVESQTITYVNSDLVTVTTPTAGAPTSVMPGDTVTLQFKEKGANKYLLPCTVTGVTPTTNENGTLTFVMPTAAVSVTFAVGDALPVTFAEDVTGHILNLASLKIHRAIGDGGYTSAKASSKAYVMPSDITPDTGVGVVGIKVNNGDTIAMTSGGYFGNYFEFTMPDSGTVTITIVTAYTYNASLATVTGITAYFSGTSPFVAGATVSGSFYFDSSLSFIDHFAVTDTAGVDVTSSVPVTVDASAKTFSFTMPSKDITLTPVLGTNTALSVTFDYGTHSADFVQTGTSRSQLYNATTYNTSYFPAVTGDTEVSFKAGDTYSLTVALVNSNYDVQLVATAGTSSVTMSPDSTSVSESTGIKTISFNNKYSYYTISANTVFSFVFTAVSAVTSTVTNTVGATLTYTINGQAATDLTHLHVGDYLGVTTDDAGVNQMYTVAVNVGETALTKDYYGYYQITGNIAIVIAKVTGYKVTVTCPLSDSGYQQYSLSDTAYNTYKSGVEVATGTAMTIEPYIKAHVKINMSGKTAADIDADYDAYASVSFTPTGDTAITITAIS